ncbi:MAG: polysulfide reductase NrfD [Chloroflexi bacterium]|nr:polysulfide reductase NrfD [Chloroflexota bacterium]
MATIAEARPEAKGMPYGIGQFGPISLLAIIVLTAIVAVGAYAYAQQLIEGEIVTGLGDVGTMGGTPWGIYIVLELYAVGIGFGAMLLLAITRIMGLSRLQPLARTLSLIAPAALLAGALSVIVDLGQPLRGIVNLALYARPMSPFFGTFTIGVVASLLATAVYLYLDTRRDAALLAARSRGWGGFLRLIAAGYKDTPAAQKRHQRTSLALAILLLVLGVTAASTSGFVFGIQLGRPGWYGALQGPAFLALAGVTATGMLIVVASILRRVLGGEKRLDLSVFAWLSNLVMVLSLTYLYFLVAELLTMSYEGQYHEARLAQALTTGTYAPLFWVSAGLLFIPFVIGAVQALTGRYSLFLIVLSGVLVNLAALGRRFLVVVPSLTTGTLLPYGPGSYSPTWVEYTVVLGLLALGTLLCVLFMKVLPIMEVPDKQ